RIWAKSSSSCWRAPAGRLCRAPSYRRSRWRRWSGSAISRPPGRAGSTATRSGHSRSRPRSGWAAGEWLSSGGRLMRSRSPSPMRPTWRSSRTRSAAARRSIGSRGLASSRFASRPPPSTDRAVYPPRMGATEGHVTDRADLVVVGAGTVGGWASVFAKAGGLGRVVVLERGVAGGGASSRAAGIVRAQGGTPATVALGRWSIDFYNGQQPAYGTDSGFRRHGYLILAVTEEDEHAGRERVAMQQANGLDVTWLDAAEAAATAVTLSPSGHRGGSYAATDGAIDPPRNVRAYSLAMQAAGVELRERSAFTGLRTAPTPDGGTRVTAVETEAGIIETERVLLTGGPSLRAVGRLAGIRIPVGAARHTVAVLETHPVFAAGSMPMVFDIGAGLYWRLEEGGLLFGWSNPDEIPGEATSIDWGYYERMRARLGG